MDLHVLCDLDSILDTRLGVMASLGFIPSEILSNENYPKASNAEDIGKLLNITPKAWTKAYDERDESVLPMSIMTNLTLVLGKIISDSINVSSDIVLMDRYRMSINVYPYVIGPDVKSGISEALKDYLGHQVEFEYVSISPKALSVEAILSTRYDMIVYHGFNKWLRCHVNSVFRAPKLNTVQFLAPKWSDQWDRESMNVLDYKHDIPEEAQTAFLDLDKDAMFDMASAMIGAVCRVQFAPYGLWCGVTADSAQAVTEVTA